MPFPNRSGVQAIGRLRIELEFCQERRQVIDLAQLLLLLAQPRLQLAAIGLGKHAGEILHGVSDLFPGEAKRMQTRRVVDRWRVLALFFYPYQPPLRRPNREGGFAGTGWRFRREAFRMSVQPSCTTPDLFALEPTIDGIA